MILGMALSLVVIREAAVATSRLFLGFLLVKFSYSKGADRHA
jgi:hypothetical protein